MGAWSRYVYSSFTQDHNFQYSCVLRVKAQEFPCHFSAFANTSKYVAEDFQVMLQL
jgi:hypothetical protein